VDPSKNITIESINDHWVEITKAFKALTDEDIRNNYLQYGHPDGKQSFSIGIALPKWIVTEGHGKYVLLMYALVTRDKVLVASAGHLFREYDNDLGDGGVVGVLSSGEEFNEALKGNKANHGTSKLEQRILANGGDSPIIASLSEKDRRKLEDLDEGARRKALALLWAYLGRVDLDDQILNDGKCSSILFVLR
jgi:translocation protein SEC63